MRANAPVASVVLIAIGLCAAMPVHDIAIRAGGSVEEIIAKAKITKYVKPQMNRDITDWAAFGDSFAAGVSADKPRDVLNNYCSRFARSYPNQMNQDPRFPGHSTSRTFAFGACTGATMGEITSRQLEHGTPNDASYPPFGKPQIGTVSLSGNDMKFGDIVNACLYHWIGYGDCGALLKEAHQKLDDPGKSFEFEIVNALSKILAAGRIENPQFQLYVTGYIRFWNAENPQCDQTNWAPSYKAAAYLTRELRRDMNELVLKLNKLIKASVDALGHVDGGVFFVDEFERQFDGHRFCEKENDPAYHTKPIADRTWFIHYESPYTDDAAAAAAGKKKGDPSFFDQVDSKLIPPKDGKSTKDRIKSVNGDLAKLHPAYKDVDSMTKELNKLAEKDPSAKTLPTTWIRMMHPKGFGYTEMSNAVIDKVIKYGAAGTNSKDGGGKGGGKDEPKKPEQGRKCQGVKSGKFIGQDLMKAKIGEFCADAAKQKVHDKNSGSIMRKYNAGKPDEVHLSIDFPQGLDISKDLEKNCKTNMANIMDSCDGNDPKNPLNWKAGGTFGAGQVQYSIRPAADHGYTPGQCSFHLQEDESWSGVDGPGTSRKWKFHVQNMVMRDPNGKEMGRQDNMVEAGHGNPFSWKTQAMQGTLEITPEASGDYIQFAIGKQSWRSDQVKGPSRCSVGGFNSKYSPNNRNMDCFFDC
ncbi:hypothetical protein PGQ11_001939 [Apiospora arundinis]|uniref:SGNH hydrolase-type esterase domain-containing protein n=1 Tax=Apiospora arundinis TaxID=335852 RepID=A0ABR2JHB7_9PEZI